MLPTPPRRSLLPFVIVNALVIVTIAIVALSALTNLKHADDHAACRAHVVVDAQQNFNRTLSHVFTAALAQKQADVTRYIAELENQPDVLKRLEKECA